MPKQSTTSRSFLFSWYFRKNPGDGKQQRKTDLPDAIPFPMSKPEANVSEGELVNRERSSRRNMRQGKRSAVRFYREAVQVGMDAGRIHSEAVGREMYAHNFMTEAFVDEMYTPVFHREALVRKMYTSCFRREALARTMYARSFRREALCLFMNRHFREMNALSAQRNGERGGMNGELSR
jgi:hypothetical protein